MQIPHRACPVLCLPSDFCWLYPAPCSSSQTNTERINPGLISAKVSLDTAGSLGLGTPEAHEILKQTAAAEVSGNLSSDLARDY